MLIKSQAKLPLGWLGGGCWTLRVDGAALTSPFAGQLCTTKQQHIEPDEKDASCILMFYTGS